MRRLDFALGESILRYLISRPNSTRVMPPARESRVLKMNRFKQGFTRRDFLIQGAATTGLLAAGAAFGQGAANSVGVKNTVLHMIGHSHIDAAWLWPWRDGADSVLDTFRSALNRMNRSEEHTSELQSPCTLV